MKKIAIISIIVLVILIGIILIGALTCIGCPWSPGLHIEKLQVCPDEWIQNKMPGIIPDFSSEDYFILDGERRELTEFDLEWVQNNCNLEPQVVV